MGSIVQAKCPHCQKVLRIPSLWLEQYMRCKLCQQSFQAKSKTPSNKPFYPVAAPYAASSPTKFPGPLAQPATVPLAKPAAPSAKPAEPLAKPAAALTAKPPVGGAPVAGTPVGNAPGTPVGNAPGSPPSDIITGTAVAQPVQGGSSSSAPTLQTITETIPSSADPFGISALNFQDEGGARTTYRRRRPSAWRGVLVGLGFMVLAGVVLLFAGDQLTDILAPLGGQKVAKKDNKKSKNKSNSQEAPNTEPKTPAPPDPDVNKPDPDVGPKPGKNQPPVQNDPPNNDPPMPKDRDPMPKDPDPKPPTKNKDPQPEPKNPTPPPPKKNPDPPVMVKQGHPRRALLISVNDYLFANPLHYGRKREELFSGSRTRDIENTLQLFLNFEGSQTYELTDFTLPGAEETPAPMKPVIEQTISDFLASSRPQDRIMLLFTGHVIESEDRKEAYLVPIEGDMDEIYDEEKKEMETLIPLSWVYEQLKACPARQKVLVLDVCRYNPGRGEERPGSDAMGPILDKMLQEPPEGVQVWSSCILDQHSYEFESGSVFMQAFCLTVQNLKMIQDPDDLLPLEHIVPRVNELMSKALEPLELKQTSRLTGNPPKTGASYDGSQPMPTPLVVEPPPVKGGAAGRAVVQSILDEINAAPPPRAGRPGVQDDLRFTTLPPFSAEDLKEFAKDGYIDESEFVKPEMAKKFPLRAAVVQAKETLRENAKDRMREKFAGPTSGNVKDRIREEQKKPGKAIFFLEDALEELLDAEEFLEKEPSKRWKAHYHYVVARLKSRLIFLYEYNFLLANIRSDDLPGLTDGATGYRVGAVRKTNIREGVVRQWQRDLRTHWEDIIIDYEGTPWALMARREQLTHLGLEWRAYKE